MRKEVPEVGWGDFTVLPSHDPAVLIIRYDWRNNSVLFVHNLDSKPHEIRFRVRVDGMHSKEDALLVNLLSEDRSRARTGDEHLLGIEACRWCRVGGLDYLLRRTGIDTSAIKCLRKLHSRFDGDLWG
jgi:maltose alpha-D-glucosyltransferase/alpha-amylase